MSLKANVKKYRAARGLSQSELATMAGISVSTVQAIEQGARGTRPSADLLLKLSHALKVSVETLMK